MLTFSKSFFCYEPLEGIMFGNGKSSSQKNVNYIFELKCSVRFPQGVV